MLNTLLGLSALILFYFGAYKLVKDHFKVNFFFIPVFINLVIMLLLYVASLIGALSPAVWVIGAAGILYFIFYIIRNRKNATTDAKSAIILWVGAFKAFFSWKSIFQVTLLFLISAASSFSFLNMVINIWVHDKGLILALIILITVPIFPFIYFQVNQSLELARKKSGYRNISIIIFILSIVFFGFFLRENKYLIPKTDRISIQNLGTKHTASGQSDIVFIEVKDKSTGVKLQYEPSDKWSSVSPANETNGIISSQRGDTLVLDYFDKGPTRYEFLFLRTPTSGVVEIKINKTVHSFDLFNESVNQKTIDISSDYFPIDILILCANLLFAISLFQIVFKYIYLYETGEEGSFLSKYNKYIFYVFLVIALFLFTRPMHYFVWDEFSHWGTFIKELSIKNNLPMDNFCTVVPRYIPGITLFEYFFTTFLGYAEGHAYFAYLLFIISAVWVVLTDLPKHKIAIKILYLLAILCALFVLPLYFISMYIDAALGLLFGVGLIFYIKNRESSPGTAGLFLIFCGLQLMKTWGLVFSIIIAGVIFLDKILFQNKKNQKEKSNHKKQVFFLLLALIISILLVQVPWNIHLQKNEIKNSFIDGGGVLDSIQNGIQLDIKTLFNSWIEITVKGRQDTYLHGALSILCLSLVLLFVGILVSKKEKQIVWVNLTIYLFFIINTLLLFVSYIIYFPVEEGIKLASYERYASEFFLGWFLLLIYQFSTNHYRGFCSRRASNSAHLFLVLMVALCIPSANKLIKLPPQNYIGRRENLRYILEKYEDILFDGKTHSVFHIAQNTNGLSHLMLRYELCPNTSQYSAQNDGWSFGEPYPSSIAECDTMPYTIDKLHTIITSEYEYVLVTKPDEQLWQDYGDIFHGYKLDGDQLFKVDKDGQINIVE